jgi:hypothetical protein
MPYALPDPVSCPRLRLLSQNKYKSFFQQLQRLLKPLTRGFVHRNHRSTIILSSGWETEPGLAVL